MECDRMSWKVCNTICQVWVYQWVWVGVVPLTPRGLPLQFPISVLHLSQHFKNALSLVHSTFSHLIQLSVQSFDLAQDSMTLVSQLGFILSLHYSNHSTLCSILTVFIFELYRYFDLQLDQCEMILSITHSDSGSLKSATCIFIHLGKSWLLFNTYILRQEE